jgi:hypothetical protein
MFTVYLKQTLGTQFTFMGSWGGNSVFKIMAANLGYPTIYKAKTVELTRYKNPLL